MKNLNQDLKLWIVTISTSEETDLYNKNMLQTTHTHTHTHIHTHTCTHTSTYTHIHTKHTHTNILHIRINTNIHTHMHTCTTCTHKTHTSTYTHMHTYPHKTYTHKTYTHKHTNILHIYTQTYTHTYTQSIYMKLLLTHDDFVPGPIKVLHCHSIFTISWTTQSSLVDQISQISPWEETKQHYILTAQLQVSWSIFLTFAKILS